MGPQNLWWDALNTQDERFEIKPTVRGLADPQTQKHDFPGRMIFEPVLGGTGHSTYSRVMFTTILFTQIFFRFFIVVVSMLRMLQYLGTDQRDSVTSPIHSNMICTHFHTIFG